MPTLVGIVPLLALASALAGLQVLHHVVGGVRGEAAGSQDLEGSSNNTRQDFWASRQVPCVFQFYISGKSHFFLGA